MVPRLIEGLPPLPLQLAWFQAQLERDGPRPWSTPKATSAQDARRVKRNAGARGLLGGSVPLRIRTLLVRQGAMHRADLQAALPRTRATSIDSALCELRKRHLVERCAKGTYRALQTDLDAAAPTIKASILGLIDKAGSASRQELFAALPDVKIVSVSTSLKRLLSDRIIERCGPARYRRTGAM